MIQVIEEKTVLTGLVSRFAQSGWTNEIDDTFPSVFYNVHLGKGLTVD